MEITYRHRDLHGILLFVVITRVITWGVRKGMMEDQMEKNCKGSPKP